MSTPSFVMQKGPCLTRTRAAAVDVLTNYNEASSTNRTSAQHLLCTASKLVLTRF